MTGPIPRIAVTPGEPAGIGPDLVIELAQQAHDCELVAIGAKALLAERANALNLPLAIRDYSADTPPRPGKAGELVVDNIELAATCEAGLLNKANSPYVLSTLERAGRGCLTEEFSALVTAPVQKSVIIESGTTFSGHTEFLADLCGTDLPVMLLCSGDLRVALVTTHLSLADVPAHITQDRVRSICRILSADLKQKFGIHRPRIAVLGLNPHAGEAGQLGREEIEVIQPVIAELCAAGLNLTGPLPADSAFTQNSLQHFDAVLAMYHDQGLPVLKHAGFGNAVNVTLGLPIIRTSVDHGTALELAGTGKADCGSLNAALRLANALVARNGR